MSEKLIIQNFAAIKEANIDVGPINILIGPQATGKSVCAKSLYYFKSFVRELFSNYIELNVTKQECDKSLLMKFEKYFPPQSLGASDFLLRYEAGNAYIQIKKEKNELTLDYSELYTKNLDALQSQFRSNTKLTEQGGNPNYRFMVLPELRQAFYSNLKNELEIDPPYGQLFIPAGRSFFAILQNSIFSFLSHDTNTLDPVLAEFGSLYEAIKKSRFESPYFAEISTSNSPNVLKEKIDFIVESILHGKYEQKNGKEYLISQDNRRVSLDNSSSGQQGMLPLAIILGAIPFMGFFEKNGTTVYIEEPEAHLFPTAQKKIVELVATIFNLSEIPAQFFITTHSPYVLASFNNLIHAGNLSSTIPDARKEDLKKIVPEEQWLKSNQVNVYSVDGGKFESIKSEETGLISTNLLDGVSDEIGEQFDGLLDLE